jgi:hypothetical protein
VEKQRVVAVDQKLIEGEAARCCVGDTSGQAIDAISDLVKLGLHTGLQSIMRRLLNEEIATSTVNLPAFSPAAAF